jgi:hypothetical protein
MDGHIPYRSVVGIEHALPIYYLGQPCLVVPCEENHFQIMAVSPRLNTHLQIRPEILGFLAAAQEAFMTHGVMVQFWPGATQAPIFIVALRALLTLCASHCGFRVQ